MTAGPKRIGSLLVLYDPKCELCRRCRSWMEGQPALVPLQFEPCDSAIAKTRYGAVPWLGLELVVVSDLGDVWAGPAAFIVCLWALADWRAWSYRLSSSGLAFIARFAFRALSSNRSQLSRWLEPAMRRCDGSCDSSHTVRGNR